VPGDVSSELELDAALVVRSASYETEPDGLVDPLVEDVDRFEQAFGAGLAPLDESSFGVLQALGGPRGPEGLENPQECVGTHDDLARTPVDEVGRHPAKAGQFVEGFDTH
jgi:hypothetical protein